MSKMSRMVLTIALLNDFRADRTGDYIQPANNAGAVHTEIITVPNGVGYNPRLRAGNRGLKVSRLQIANVLSLVAALLTTASFVVVVYYAGPEPYSDYQRHDAVLVVGVGTSLIIGWGCWSVAIVAFVVARCIRPYWLFACLWAVVCIYYLLMGVNGYLDDLEQFMLFNSPDRPQQSAN